MKSVFSLLLVIIIAAGMVFPCYASEDSIDSVDDAAVADVYALYMSAFTWSEAAVKDGAAEVTTKDGYVVTVAGIPGGAVKLVVYSIPSSDEDAWNWLGDCIDEDYELKRAFDIYFEDMNGNRINANGVQVTIRRCDDECVVFSVKTNGQARRLNSTNKDGAVSFSADGSNYYTLAIKNTTTIPTEPDEPTIPTDPSTPATGDESHISLWLALVVISGFILIWLMFWRK